MSRVIRILLPFAAVVSGQQVSPPATFHTATQLVQVSVVAQDQDGNPVTHLRREDFQIFDNGAPQQIQLFIADEPAPREAEAKASGTFSNQLGGSAGGGYSVLLFDNLNMDLSGAVFGHTARARIKALQAMQSIPPGDKIAIYSLWCQFQVVREFTSDRDSLLQQLQAFAPGAGSCADPTIDPGPARVSMGQMTLPDGTPRVGAFSTAPPPPPPGSHGDTGSGADARTITADIADREMKQLAEHLAGIPGRKNLIWLTSTFRISPANLQRLIGANVAIYPVDTIGSTIAVASEKAAHAAPLRALAALTGGIAYVDRDDLDTAVSQALNDGHISYTLGYYQPESAGETPVHQIRIGVNRPGVTLRYRTTYTIQPEPPPPADSPHALIQAMSRPVNATGIPITASLTRQQDQLDVAASFGISSLDFQLTDELWRGKAEVLARFMTADGIQAGNTTAETMSFTLKPATYTSMLEKGAAYRRRIAIPANAVELDLLVGSLATGKFGTLKIPLSEVVNAPPATGNPQK